MPIKKKIVKKDLEIIYKNKFIDSYRFMASSLSKLVDNLSEGIHNNKCSDCGSNLDYIKITAKRKNEKLILGCYNCKQHYKKKFNKELVKRFASTYSFCNNDLNKFILLLKDKTSTINPKNNDHKCFQYAVTLALNLDKIKKEPQRVSKTKPFIQKYNWEDIDFPSTSKDWKKFERNNEIALNILYPIILNK